MRCCTVALLTALLWAPQATADVLCPIDGGFSEIVPESEREERPHKSRTGERRGDSVGQSPDPRELEAGTISGPSARVQIQSPHNRDPNWRPYGPVNRNR
jgi:hypothetical protein